MKNMMEVIKDGLKEMSAVIISAYIFGLMITGLILVVCDSFQIKTFIVCSVCAACILFVIVVVVELAVAKYFKEW